MLIPRMLTEVLGKQVLIAGLKGVRIGDPASLIESLRKREELSGLAFQLLNAERVAGEEHLLLSVLNALRAMELGLNVSPDLGMEILVSASGQRQISRAIELLGLRPGVMDVAVVLVSGAEEDLGGALEVLVSALGGERDDGVLDVDEAKAEELIKIFDIGRNELESCSRLGPMPEIVKALVLEKVALFMAYR